MIKDHIELKFLQTLNHHLEIQVYVSNNAIIKKTLPFTPFNKI